MAANSINITRRRGPFQIPRFFGLDTKTNPIDVHDGFSPDCQNVYQNRSGVITKRPGNDVMFDSDEDASTAVDELGTCTILGTKYFFKFAGGKFKYATSLNGALTTLSPSPAISTINQVWYAVAGDKLFFVDGTNNLRYFGMDAQTGLLLGVYDSVIYARPTVALTSASGAGGFTYVYTVDNGSGESPVVTTLLPSIISAATVAVAKNTGPQTLVVGDVVRIYSRADTIAAASKLVATHTVVLADLAGATFNVATVAISDTQSQLYSELGVAVNKTAPTALVGLTEHYGRLVGWKGDSVYNSKVSNQHSWPDDSAQHEAFTYSVWKGDGEGVQSCVSFRESLFVFKKTKLAVFGGIGPDDTGNNAYSFRRVETNGHGCTAPKSAKVVGEESKNYIVYRSASGFFATNGTTPTRIGEKIEPSVQSVSLSNQATGCAIHHKREGVYVYFEGAPTTKTGWILDVREDNGVLVGWFKWSGINPRCVFWDGDRFMFGTSLGVACVERIAGIGADFSDAGVEYVAAAAVNTGTDVITVATSYQTGDAVRVRTTGTIPAGVTANATYFAIRVSATQIKLATSAALALAGTAIDITTQGVGTHSLVSPVAINAYYTTNWMKFFTSAHVKKLKKLGLSFNASASSVSIVVSCAYDWVESFSDPQTVAIGSSDLWGTLPWGSFVWGLGATASPRNVAIARRKCRSIRYKFANSSLNQDFNLQGLEQEFEILRNRGNFA